MEITLTAQNVVLHEVFNEMFVLELINLLCIRLVLLSKMIENVLTLLFAEHFVNCVSLGYHNKPPVDHLQKY